MIAALLALWTGVVTPITAQQPTPDSATLARVQAALKHVQDSLDRVRGATFNFRADLAAASPVALYHRARRMQASCLAADGALAHLDSVLTASYPAAAAAALRREVSALRTALTECRRDYDTTARWAERADSVRAWAPYRLSRLDEAVRSYNRVASGPLRPERAAPQ